MRLRNVVIWHAAAAVCAAFLAWTASAAPTPKSGAPFETKAKFAVLMDEESNLVLFEKNPDVLMHPASMSKLMTLAIAFRNLKEGKFKLEDTFTVSENAWRKGGAPSGSSAMFAPLNTQVTIQDLIPGIAVQSGNDAAMILAEGQAGSEEAFAQQMTEYARSIGMKKSTFRNSTGLPDPGHLMTARELAMLARHLIREYPEYYHFFGQKDFTFNKHRFVNRNPLIFSDLGVDGLKTGFIDESGYGLVASAKQGDQRLILVINGLQSKREREEEARKLLEWGFKSFRPFMLFNEGETVSEAMVWGGTKHFLPVIGDGKVEILLPPTANKKVKAELVYEGPLKAPIRKGDQVAVLRVTAPEMATNEIPLYAAENVERSNFLMRGLDSLLVLAFGWVL